jgi:hypothetical protein
MFWVIYYNFNRGFQCTPHSGNGNGNYLLQHITYKILLNSVMRICHFVTYLTFCNTETQTEVTSLSILMKCLNISQCSHQETPSVKILASPSQEGIRERGGCAIERFGGWFLFICLAFAILDLKSRGLVYAKLVL